MSMMSVRKLLITTDSHVYLPELWYTIKYKLKSQSAAALQELSERTTSYDWGC